MPRGVIRDDDAVIFFNFRADRARQMTKRAGGTGIQGIQRSRSAEKSGIRGDDAVREDVAVAAIPSGAGEAGEYSGECVRGAAVQKFALRGNGEIRARTYFFNGGVEKPFPGEERVLVPSPKVPTYDLKPEMSAAGVADAVIKAIEKGDFDAIIMNFANADMVGTFGEARSDDQGRGDD